MVTSVKSATRNSFSVIYTHGKVEQKRFIAGLYIAKFGDERENLIIARSFSECFHTKVESVGHPLSRGTPGAADAVLEKP